LETRCHQFAGHALVHHSAAPHPDRGDLFHLRESSARAGPMFGEYPLIFRDQGLDRHALGWGDNEVRQHPAILSLTDGQPLPCSWMFLLTQTHNSLFTDRFPAVHLQPIHTPSKPLTAHPLAFRVVVVMSQMLSEIRLGLFEILLWTSGEHGLCCGLKRRLM